MTEQEALEIIQNENLDGTNFFSTNRLHFESTVIMKVDNSWEVYIYGEKGGKEGFVSYDNESEALVDYLERLRAWKRVVSYRERRKAR